ncbi:MAG: AAA family ATPase [Desulfurivibrio sp.]|nr:AAA family ATPase [Desulfurivibrio sp.]
MPNGEPTATSPTLYVFWGMIATGKSTLAAAWAAELRIRHYNSDVVRKQLAGLDPAARHQEAMERGLYSAEQTRRTYEELQRLAAEELQAGRKVILDASYLQRWQRQPVVELARRLGVEYFFIFCDCHDTVKQQRLARRARDPAAVSDGRWEIYLGQRQKFEPATELPAARCLNLDTERPVAELMAELQKALTAG